MAWPVRFAAVHHDCGHPTTCDAWWGLEISHIQLSILSPERDGHRPRSNREARWGRPQSTEIHLKDDGLFHGRPWEAVGDSHN